MGGSPTGLLGPCSVEGSDHVLFIVGLPAPATVLDFKEAFLKVLKTLSDAVFSVVNPY